VATSRRKPSTRHGRGRGTEAAARADRGPDRDGAARSERAAGPSRGPAREAAGNDRTAGRNSGVVGTDHGAGNDSGAGGRKRGGPRRLPPVRLAPREELAGAARVAPLLRAARDLTRWVRRRGDVAEGPLSLAVTEAAAADLEIAPAEVEAAWQVAEATWMLAPGGSKDLEPGPGGMLATADTDHMLALWEGALAAALRAEELDGLATALYTVGGPVTMEGLFDAYAAAAGTLRAKHGGQRPDHGAALSAALETLADLGVVELGTEEPGGGLTVALSPLGIWGVHRRLRAQGWHAPVLGAARDGAAAFLETLASCDAEDGEAEIGAWLAARSGPKAAAELIRAASGGSPGLRGAAFAVLDRIGDSAVREVREALTDPVLRAHAAVWLHEHGEEAELGPEDRTWLLVDLGAGLLEEADPRDVVAELLPDMPPAAQVEIVAGLWQVSHPEVTDLLTALSQHHPDPAVARAARKAAFKARSPGSHHRTS
jgi:hypothetical protein